MLRTLTRLQLLADVVAAALLLLVVVWSAVAVSPIAGPIVAVLLCGALAVRRLSPGLALVGVWAGALLQIATLVTPTPADAAVLGVAYASAAYGGRTVRWLGLASAVVGGMLAAAYLTLSSRHAYIRPLGPPEQTVVALAAVTVAMVTLLGLSWTLGLLARIVRQSREAKAQAAAAAQRAAYESAIEQERTRIARDMHDVVAHSLAVVIAQADGARYAAAASVDLRTEALATISATARSALADVRVLLTRLRREVPDGPQPSLDDLPVLIAGMRGAGLRINDTISGRPVPLLQGTGLAAYRILQEALTNALRHGDSRRPVGVELCWEPEALRLRVRNAMPERSGMTGPLEAKAPSGHGIPGMRERAALAGGTLRAGMLSEPEPAYEVVAVLHAVRPGEVVP